VPGVEQVRFEPGGQVPTILHGDEHRSMRDSDEHPVKRREAVTSPAGTTIAAIRELENPAVRAALPVALEAARRRRRLCGKGVTYETFPEIYSCLPWAYHRFRLDR
jgi:Pyrroline-5-carboxylate reductase dimerisation